MRKPHNKGKSRINYVGGKYGYISRRERLSPLYALCFTILCGVVSLGYGKYARAQQFYTENVNPAMENNLIQSFFSEYGIKEEEEKSERQQILEYIVEVFGEDSAEAITMIRKCENSKFNPKATNWNRNGTWDTGVFQINQVHGYSLEEMQDYRKNIDAAKKIFDSRGWTAWSCSHEVGVKPFYLR